MTRYKHIFIDLDNTLWDYKANAREAFHDIFTEMDLFTKIRDFRRFLLVYEHYSEHMWSEYRKGNMRKEMMRIERMKKTFSEMGIDDADLARRVGENYLSLAPKKTNLFHRVHETLTYLKEKYKLYILTNGFTDIQMQKISNSGLHVYFSKLFMAEMAGYHKPDKRFFEYAIKSVHARKVECLMIGDDPEADISGAAEAGIHQVYFNPGHKQCSLRPTWEIRSFEELMTIL